MLYSVELQTKLYTLRFSSKWIQQSRFLLKNMSRIVVSNLILLHYAMVFRKKIHARGLLEKILSCFHTSFSRPSCNIKVYRLPNYVLDTCNSVSASCAPLSCVCSKAPSWKGLKGSYLSLWLCYVFRHFLKDFMCSSVSFSVILKKIWVAFWD